MFVLVYTRGALHLVNPLYACVDKIVFVALFVKKIVFSFLVGSVIFFNLSRLLF